MKTTLLQFFQFSLVGQISFAVDVAALWLLADYMPLLWARIIAFSFAVFTNWVCHRLYTFKEHATRDAKLREAIQFSLASVLGLVPNVGVYWWVIHTDSYQTHAANELAPIVAMLPGIILGHGLNFVLSKYWVFKQSGDLLDYP